MKRMSTFVGICMLILVGTAFSQDYTTIAKNYLSTHHEELGLTAGDWDDLEFQRAYTDDYSGATHIYLKQRFNQIGVHEAILNLTMDKTGEIVYISHRLAPKLNSSITDRSPQISPFPGTSGCQFTFRANLLGRTCYTKNSGRS